MESKILTSGHSFEAKNLGHEHSPEANRPVGVEAKKDFSPERGGVESQSSEPSSSPVQLPKVAIAKQDDRAVPHKEDTSPNKKDNSPSDDADKNGLIEKEWVDRAKKVIAETKADPYMQEKEISKLQADYLKERYGKDVKVDS